MPSSCDKLVQFDTVAMSQSMATLYSALQFVNTDNYEEIKTSAAANVPGYFDGTYDQFKQQRNKLTSLFTSSGLSTLSSDYYRHTLSASGAKAYAQCLANESAKPIAAWIEEVTDDQLVISVRCGLAGGTVEFTIAGKQPTGGGRKKPKSDHNNPDEIETTYVLNGGGVTALIFEYSRKENFLVIINAVVPALDNAQSATVVNLPRVREFELRHEVKPITGSLRVAAGGNGNTSGNRYCTACTLTAPDGFHLEKVLPQSISEVVVGGPGIRSYRVDWSNVDGAEGIRAMVGQPDVNSLDGNNGNTQGTTEVTYTINAIREYLVEV